MFGSVLIRLFELYKFLSAEIQGESMRVLLILTILIASPAMADIFSGYDIAQRKAQKREIADLMKPANALVDYHLEIANETQKRIDALNLREMAYRQRKLDKNK
jgi:hypothetical protein